MTDGAGDGVAGFAATWLGGVDGVTGRGKGEAVKTGASVTGMDRMGGVRGAMIGIGADGSGVVTTLSSVLESTATRRREWKTIVFG